MKSRFTELIPGMFRGPRPTLTELASWSPRLRAVIDLEPVRIAKGEQSDAAKLGINEQLCPMSSIWPPNHATVIEVAKKLETAALPVLVHCHQGVDRTGVVIAFWRVMFCQWDPDWALDEMLSMGFHRWRYRYWMPSIRRLLERRT
ncbi:MAG: tyrosine-protein phosphatase [Methylocella sp.]